MNFIDQTDCKLSISNGSVTILSTSKIKNIFLLTLDFAAESTRCRGMISSLQYRIRWQLTSDESCNTFRLCIGLIVITWHKLLFFLAGKSMWNHWWKR